MEIRCNEFNMLIDDYLRGEMQGQKQEAFESHYFECDNCFAALKVAERLHSKEIPIVLTGKKRVPVLDWLFNWKPMTAMAAVAIVAVVSIFMIQRSNRLDFLYSVSDVPAPGYMLSETRDPDVATRSIGSRFDEAMLQYNRKNYEGALKMLNEIQSPDSNPQVIFYRGICMLYTGDSKAAVSEMDKIIEAMNPSYYDEAIYYKAIALLRSGEEKQALELLNHLAGMFSPHAPKAKALIEKISQ